jgi:hypothetical protein
MACGLALPAIAGEREQRKLTDPAALLGRDRAAVSPGVRVAIFAGLADRGEGAVDPGLAIPPLIPLHREQRIVPDVGALLASDKAALLPGVRHAPAMSTGALTPIVYRIDVRAPLPMLAAGYDLLGLDLSSEAPLTVRPASAAALPGASLRPSEWALRDALSKLPRARKHRSALDAMLTLRIDGNRDSEPFSITGGVAAALWKVVPGN